MFKILVAHDSSVVLLALESLLIDKGYQVSSTVNPLDAVEKAFRERPDLLLIDLDIKGGMSGTELSTSLQRAFPKLKVITLSWFNKEKLKSRTEGVDSFGNIIKPIDFDHILNVVNDCLHSTN